MFNLRQWKSTFLRQEQAQTNRFEIMINLPKILGNNSEAARYVSLRCENFQYPERTILSAPDDNVYGPPREMPQGVVQSSTITGTFWCNKDLDEKVFFEEWQKKIYQPGTYNMNYYNDIVGEIHIFQLSKGRSSSIPGNFLTFTGATEEKTKYGVKLFEVYPKTIQAQELNTDSGLQKLSIDFAYRYWEGIGREPSKNLNDYIADNLPGSNEYELFDVKGILTDILGKSGAGPTVVAGGRAAADLLLE